MKTPILAVVWLALTAAGEADRSDAAVGAQSAIITQDLEESSAGYEKVIGPERRSDVTRPGRFRIGNLVGDGLSVELIELVAVTPRPERRITGPFKLGFQVDDINSFIAGLPADIEPPRTITDDRNGVRFVQLRDPDGNTVQVLQHLGEGN